MAIDHVLFSPFLASKGQKEVNYTIKWDKNCFDVSLRIMIESKSSCKKNLTKQCLQPSNIISLANLMDISQLG